MAIQEFGQSLLSDIRERNERERRRARKREEKDLLLGIGMKVADSALTSYANRKTNKFLQSETFLANNLQYKTQLKRATLDVTDTNGNAEDANFLLNKYLPETLARFQAIAPASASATDIKSQAMYEAQRRAEERLAELNDERVKAARSLVSSSGGSETAYRDAVIASRSSGGIRGLVTGFGNLITGGTAHDAALTTDMYGKSETYKSLYKQNPTLALDTVERIENLKKSGISFKEANFVFEKPESLEVYDPITGGTTKTSIQSATQNGIYVGYQDLSTQEFVHTYSPEQKKRVKNVARIVTPERAEQIRATTFSVINDEQRDQLVEVFTAAYGTTQDDSASAKAIKQHFYGNLGLNAGLLEQDFNMQRPIAYAVAAEMEILRQQMLGGGKIGMMGGIERNRVIGLELETNAESVSPILALAALDSLEEKNTLRRSEDTYDNVRRTLEDNFKGGNESVSKFIETFAGLDVSTQSDLFDWMRPYRSLNQERANGLSIIETLQRNHAHLTNTKYVNRRNR